VVYAEDGGLRGGDPMKDRLGLIGHRCPGCGVSLPEWEPVCHACAERNRREETEAWLLERGIARELDDRMLAEHPGRPVRPVRGNSKARRGDGHEKA
jgi:hypothetical protein